MAIWICAIASPPCSPIELPFARNAHGILHGVAGGWTGNLLGSWQSGQHYTVSPTGVGGGGGGGGTGYGASCYTPSQVLGSYNSTTQTFGLTQPGWCSVNWSGIYTDVRPNVVPGCDPTKNNATLQAFASTSGSTLLASSFSPMGRSETRGATSMLVQSWSAPTSP